MNRAKETQARLSRMERVGYALIAAMPLLALVDLFPIAHLGSLNIRPTDPLFVFAWVLCGFDLLFSMRAPNGFMAFVVGILLIVSATVIGVLFLGNSVDWRSYGRFIQTLLWGGLAIAFIRTERQFQRYGDMVILCALVASAISLYFYIRNPELQRVAASFAEIEEAPDVPGGINAWASFYVLALIILLWRVYRGTWSFRRVGAMGLISFGLLLIQSRSAFLSFGLMTLVFMGLWVRRMNREGLDWRAVAAIGCLLALVVGIVTGSDYLPVNRIKDSFVSGSWEDVSTKDRYIGWRRSRQMIWDANAAQLMVGYGNERFPYLSGTPTSESFYFDHGVSEGFPALGIMLMLLLAPAFKLRRKGIFSHQFILAMLITMNALLVSITGNVFVAPILGGTTLTLLYGTFSVNRQARPLEDR
jgi:hypothetical protein